MNKKQRVFISRLVSFNNLLYQQFFQVSSLRSAITYINCLKDLLQDCDAGRVGEEVYRNSVLLDLSDKKKISEDHKVRQGPGKQRASKKKLVIDKTVKKKAVHDKWISYSGNNLKRKFGSSVNQEISCNSVPFIDEQILSPGPSRPLASSSFPRDVIEISHHISMLKYISNISSEFSGIVLSLPLTS